MPGLSGCGGTPKGDLSSLEGGGEFDPIRELTSNDDLGLLLWHPLETPPLLL